MVGYDWKEYVVIDAQCMFYGGVGDGIMGWYWPWGLCGLNDEEEHKLDVDGARFKAIGMDSWEDE